MKIYRKKNVIISHRTQGKGVEAVHLKGIAEGFINSGYDVTFVSPPGVIVSTEESKKGAVSWVAKFLPQLVFELFEIFSNYPIKKKYQQEYAKNGCDLIYERYAFMSWIGVKMANAWKIPLILEVNYTSLDDLCVRKRTKVLKPFLQNIEKYIFKNASLLLPVSSFLAEELIEMGIDKKRILVSPNAVDLSDAIISEIDNEIKNKYIFRNGPVIGFVGSFAPWHKVDFLVDACLSLSEQVENLNLLLVGDGPMYQAIEKKLKDCDTLNSILIGRVGHKSIYKYIQLMDIAVMPHSNNYGSPMKVFEYMAMGKAVVAPDYSPLRDAIDNYKDGVLFEPGSFEKFESSLYRLITDEEMRKKIAKNARKRVEQDHNWNNRVKKALKQLESLNN